MYTKHYIEQQKQMNHFTKLPISHNRRQSFRQELLQNDVQEISDRNIISPWILREPQYQPPAAQKQTSATQNFLSKLQLRSTKKSQTQPLPTASNLLDDRKMQTTLIAFPRRASLDFKQDEYFTERKKQTRVLKLKRVVLQNMEDKSNFGISEPKDYGLRLFQMKWRTRALKRQRMDKKKEQGVVTLNDYFMQTNLKQAKPQDHSLKWVSSPQQRNRTVKYGRTVSGFQ